MIAKKVRCKIRHITTIEKIKKESGKGYGMEIRYQFKGRESKSCNEEFKLRKDHPTGTVQKYKREKRLK